MCLIHREVTYAHRVSFQKNSNNYDDVDVFSSLFIKNNHNMQSIIAMPLMKKCICSLGPLLFSSFFLYKTRLEGYGMMFVAMNFLFLLLSFDKKITIKFTCKGIIAMSK